MGSSYYDIAEDEYQFFMSIDSDHLPQQIGFLGQQIVEKLLKHIIVTSEKPIEDDMIVRTYNLKKLYRFIKAEIVDLDLDMGDLVQVSNYYFETRYPGDNFMWLTEEEKKDCVRIVKEIKEKVDTYLGRSTVHQ